jgi:hypothetical protein
MYGNKDRRGNRQDNFRMSPLLGKGQLLSPRFNHTGTLSAERIEPNDRTAAAEMETTTERVELDTDTRR